MSISDHVLRQLIRKHLTDDLRKAPWKGSKNKFAGHCYVASEAWYHLKGGKAAGLKPVALRHEGASHWWIRHSDGVDVDLTVEQFNTPVPYEQGRGCGFLTRRPSQRAQILIDRVQADLADSRM